MEEVNFEEAMKKLEDQSVQKFEEGMALAKKCNDILEKAEKRITILIQEEEGLKEENFVPQED